ncbi:MAG: Toprim subdomain protein [Candidatus Methanomethylophilaceae archaeon]|jgi:dTMP kinase
MSNSGDRLQELELVLEELNELDEKDIILVEGRKDRMALAIMGISHETREVQNVGGIFPLAESLARDGRRAVILTDWDRTGGQIARNLRDALGANGVPYDDGARARISRICRKDIKDVESLPSFYSRLVTEAERRRELPDNQR